MKFQIKKHIRKTPYQTALLVAASITLYLIFVPKYTSYEIDHFNTFRQVYYADLNSDGQVEMIEYFGYPLSSEYDRATVIMKSLDNAYLGIWNHKGRNLRVSNPVMCDYNHDGITEIFSFHRQKDSIFINGINPDSSDVFFIESRFVDKTRWVNNTVNLKVIGYGHVDYNSDGTEDIVFQIDAGFSLQPRNTYVFDIKNDTILKSPPSYVHLTFPHGLLFDLDKNGKKEVILSTHASENTDNFALPYHDNSTYIMVLNDQLEFINEPYEIKGPMARIRAYPVARPDKNYISVHYHNFGDQFGDSLFIFNDKVELNKAICLDSITEKYESSVNLRFRLKQSDYKYLKNNIIGLKNGLIFQFDNELNITKKIKTKIAPLNHATQLELNGDSSNVEYLIASNKKIYFTDHNFKVLTSPEIEIEEFRNFGRISKNGSTQKFFVQNKDSVYHILFKINPWYKYAWIVNLIISLIIWFVIVLAKAIVSYVRRTQMIKVLRERDSHKTQLARELHDELGSKITGLRLMLENMNTTDSVKEVNNLSAHLQKAHQEIRNIIYNLAPPRLENRSFSLTIKELIRSFEDYSKIKFQLEFLPDEVILNKLGDQQKTELFRIIQESLTNIIKHAGANNIIIQFMLQKHYLEVFVEDDGVGFEADNITSGQGLMSMETRAKMMKGYFHIYSDKGKGTSIAIQVPVKAKKGKN